MCVWWGGLWGMKLRASCFYHEHFTHSDASPFLPVLWSLDLWTSIGWYMMLYVPCYTDSVSSLSRYWKHNVLEESTDRGGFSMMGSDSSLLIFCAGLSFSPWPDSCLPQVAGVTTEQLRHGWTVRTCASIFFFIEAQERFVLSDMDLGTLIFDGLHYCFSAQFLTISVAIIEIRMASFYFKSQRSEVQKYSRKLGTWLGW